MTTFKARAPYTDAELAALYPPQLELQLVQVLLRHGERTPVTPRFTNAGLHPFWPYCAAVRNLKSTVAESANLAVTKEGSGGFTTLEWKSRLETFGPHDAPVIAAGPAGEVDNICDMGMLTDKGRETTHKLGERLRHLYVNQLHFLPSTLTTTDFMYLRATPIPRALESLQQAFQGLYPSSKRSPDLSPPTILTRAVTDETLFPNDGGCRRFAVLARAFAQRTANRWNETEEMEYLNKKIGKWMPEHSPRVAVDSHPRISGIMDTINSTDAHGPQTKLPAEFYDPKIRQIVQTIGVEEWFSGYKENEEYRTLGIGSLLGDVVSRMMSSVEQSAIAPSAKSSSSTSTSTSAAFSSNLSSPPHVRFGLSGCHDTTLASALTSLGAFDGETWPPFTSHLAIELFQRKAPPVTTAPTERTAASQSTSMQGKGWLSFLGLGSSSPILGAPVASIGRKMTPNLTAEEKSKLNEHYVRLRYNDRPVTIPGCKSPGNHLDGDETFCTLAAFKSIVDKFTPYNWKEQCKAVDSGKPAFPTKPELAGY